jgi:hypothetical protein
VVLNDIPDNVDVGRVIGVAQSVAEVDHFLPLDLGCVPLDLIRQVSRRLAYHFEVTFRRHTPKLVCGE